MFLTPIEVLVLMGREPRFTADATRYLDFLTKEVGIPHSKVNYELPPQSEAGTRQLIHNFFNSLSSSHAVVIYTGHGFEGAFLPYGNPILYEEFARMFRVRSDFIFINDSCHSESCIRYFEFQGLLPDSGMVIASSREDEKSKNAFRESLFEMLRIGNDYDVEFIGETVETVDLSSQGSFGYKNRREREVIEWAPLKTTTQFKPIQHPVKAGKSLEHLLFTRT